MLPRIPLLTALLLTAASLAAAQLATGTAVDLASGAQATASATAGPAEGKYGPHAALDGNLNTWWAADNKRFPITFELAFPQPQQADTLLLLNADNATIYSHLKRISVSLDGGEPIERELPGEQGPFLIRFPARQVQSVKITIADSHEPDKTYIGLATVSLYHDPEQQVRLKMSPKAG